MLLIFPKINPCFLILVIFYFGISAQGVFAQDNLAASDYQDYLNSRFAKASADKYVKDGIEAFHAGDFEVAQQNLYQAFNKGCESPIVLFQLALLFENKASYYSALEYYEMAEKNFKQANKDHRYAKTFTENYGRALYMGGKKDQAIPLLFKAAKKSKSYWLLKLVGLISFERGDTLNAVSYFERAVRIQDPSVTNVELVQMYTLLARLFANKSEFDGAERYYRKVTELDPTNQEANNFLNGIKQNYQQENMFKFLEELKDF